MQDETNKKPPCTKNTQGIMLGKRHRRSKSSQKCMKTKAIELGFTPEEIKLLNRIYKEA